MRHCTLMYETRKLLPLLVNPKLLFWGKPLKNIVITYPIHGELGNCLSFSHVIIMTLLPVRKKLKNSLNSLREYYKIWCQKHNVSESLWSFSLLKESP